MEKYIDLHTHSTKSDGSMTPKELVNHAKECGLSAIALTDHDSVGGVKEAADEGGKIGIEVVRGIEISVKSETETHILGYGIDIENKELNERLSEVRNLRCTRTLKSIEKLNEAGFDINLCDVEKYAGESITCRAHIARAMVGKGYVSSVSEAFDKYLSSGKCGYVNMQYLTPEEGISLINNAGGKAFAAHLHLMKKSDDELFEYLKYLKSIGLSGIEGYYTDYTKEMHEKYMGMAKKLDLAISGGSDFHGKMKPHIEIGKGRGNLKIPYSVLENIKKLW